MLRNFRVTNHRSIRAEQELLLMPAYDKTRPVIPVAGIFGANASGKSNFLDALRFMRHAVLDSYAEWKPGTGVPRTPFKLDPAAAAEPSSYVVELLLDGVRHIYGFEIDDERVREEWLYAYPHNRRRVIFDREGQEIRLGSTVAEHKSRAAVLADLTRPNTLFLTAAAHLNVAEVLPLYQWFRASTVVLGPGLWADRDTLVQRLLPGAPGRDAVVALLRAADLGISDVVVDLVHLQVGLAGSPLRFIHGGSGVTLTLNEESEGTRAWMAAVDYLLDVMRDGQVMVVDEIDSHLHTKLTARLVELFKDPVTNTQGAQLIFTSQDASLLRRELGEDILPRDAVWFTEKGPDGATSLYAFADFKPRKDENTERRYLAGSYGAVPELYDVEFSQAVVSYRNGPLDRAAS